MADFDFRTHTCAIQCFQAMGHLRGGRISGFLGREHETFFLTKVLREVAHIDDAGRAVRAPQWIIELEAPIDVTALLREGEDREAAIAQADFSARVLEGEAVVPEVSSLAPDETAVPDVPAPSMQPGHPTLAQVMGRVGALGIDPERFGRYADECWGSGWKLNSHGRSRVWDEIERHRNDPEGYADKIDAVLGVAV
ncbi:MAG: hypothetical protein LBK55_02580 [Azoarcus sp.]|jgi:hypothetical protein|nr:hypothetical protein [Azoarcus sp.]